MKISDYVHDSPIVHDGGDDCSYLLVVYDGVLMPVVTSQKYTSSRSSSKSKVQTTHALRVKFKGKLKVS